ncbi:Leucine-rich repeat containing protein [Entamoeba marina]
MANINYASEKLTEFPQKLFSDTSCGNIHSLSLDSNYITDIPTSISKLVSMTNLSLPSNRIAQFPEEFCSLSKLLRLNLQQNKIISIPDSFSRMVGLTELHMCSNKLTTLPQTITSLSNLVRLNAAANFFIILTTYHKMILQFFLKIFFDTPNLIEIDLEFNDIIDIPVTISKMTNLARFNIRRNELTRLPSQITLITTLSNLSLEGNPIEELPSGIDTLPKLREINMSHLSNPKLTFQMKTLKSLKKIYCNGSGVDSLPDSFSELKNLEECDFSNNNLEHILCIPHKVLLGRFNCNKLRNFELDENCEMQYLYAKHNQLNEFPESLITNTKLCACDLSWNKIDCIPSRIVFTRLQILDLSFNKIQTLDPALSKLIRLKRLNVSFNQLTSIPSFISTLTGLERFYCAGNKLTTLPTELSLLQDLSVLHIGENKFNEIPDAILLMPGLLRLHICCNPVYHIRSLSSLSQLHTLDIANCYVSNCEGLNNLKMLQQLCLANNYISTPPVFSGCTSLVHIDLSFNSLVEMPQFKSYPQLAFVDVSYNDLDEVISYGPTCVVRSDGNSRIQHYKFLQRFADKLKFRSVHSTLSTAQMCSDRDEMQDSHICIPNFAGPDHFLLGVVDGHNGSFVSYQFTLLFPNIFYETLRTNVSIEEAFRISFDKIQSEFNEKRCSDGACVTIVFLTPTKIYTAQCGDCKAVYMTSNGPIQLCEEHKPTNKLEQKRIKTEGGFVDSSGRVSRLRVARSVGDVSNKPVLTHIPETACFDRLDSEEYLIVASDGLWDELISCSSDQSADNISIVLCRF